MISDWFSWEFPPERSPTEDLDSGTSSETGTRQAEALALIALLGAVLAGVAVFDIWADLALEERALWSTLPENIFPLLIALVLPYAAWQLRHKHRPRHLWNVAVWTLTGWVGTLLLAGIVLGTQVMQGELKPRIIILQIASGGAAAGFLIGLTVAELRSAWSTAEREKLFESLKQSVLEGIVIADEEGEITDWNRGAKEIFGYEKEEMIGRPIEALLPERHREPLLNGVRRVSLARDDQDQGETFELQGQRKSGEEFPLEISLSSWKVGGDRYYAAIIRDITDRRRMQREVLRIQEEERRRLGQDLHDGVASQLTGANIKLGTLTASARREDSSVEELTERVQEVQALIKESASDVRRLSRGLNPAGLAGETFRLPL